jgi:hypothetical protein
MTLAREDSACVDCAAPHSVEEEPVAQLPCDSQREVGGGEEDEQGGSGRRPHHSIGVRECYLRERSCGQTHMSACAFQGSGKTGSRKTNNV